MTLSRRDLAVLLPALAVRASAQQTAPPAPARAVLPGKIYHTDFNLEVHETILGPGMDTHAPHQHEHEEMLIIVSGALDVHVAGKSETAESGSVVYLASNVMHNAHNSGAVPCRYYVIELRGAGA